MDNYPASGAMLSEQDRRSPPSSLNSVEHFVSLCNAADIETPALLGANVLFADGRVDFVAETIAPPAWRALGTRNGGDLAAVGTSGQ
ncbi:MAG: hypothetical protein SFX72_23145 [Isosphaeraceae bacterium]|nr:hypothetical protein [Isosphaeraceae bacterium]